MTVGFFRENQDNARKSNQIYDDYTIENIKKNFKVEHDYDSLLNYIRGNRILHDSLAEP